MTLKLGGGGPLQLNPASDTNFFFLYQERPLRATFVRNAKGQVTHLYLNDGGRAYEIEKSK